MAVETAAYSEQTDIQRDITEMVRQFADEKIIPPTPSTTTTRTPSRSRSSI